MIAFEEGELAVGIVARGRSKGFKSLKRSFNFINKLKETNDENFNMKVLKK